MFANRKPPQEKTATKARKVRSASVMKAKGQASTLLAGLAELGLDGSAVLEEEDDDEDDDEPLEQEKTLGELGTSYERAARKASAGFNGDEDLTHEKIVTEDAVVEASPGGPEPRGGE